LSEVSGVVPRTIWPWEKAGHNQDAVRELQGFFGNISFPSPKPVSLIERVLQVSPGKLVLDYFAGSGTTGQAVMRLNKDEEAEDRRFILVEMGEYFDDVLKERIRRMGHRMMK
jgi:adenine-specific DNA-methyltransferase